MRDAFGGAFSIKLMLAFLILYVFFICIALNYAKAFRVKNRIINIIEQQEGMNSEASNQIGQYLTDRGYSIDCAEIDRVKCDACQCVSDIANNAQGYSYKEVSTREQRYYVVETYILFDIPIIGIDFPIAVRGETRVMENI